MCRQMIKTVLQGLAMGTADVIPGISGATVALLLGIYQRFVEALRSFDLHWLRALLRLDLRMIRTLPDWGFLLPLGGGILGAVVLFTQVIPLPTLLHTYPTVVYGLLFGLICGSTLSLLRQTALRSFKQWRFVIAGVALGWLLFGMVPLETPNTSWFLFLCGIAAMGAMMLPGVSGSFVLLMLRKYAYVLEAVGDFNLAVLLPFVLGMICGVVLFCRALTWLLKTWRTETMGTLIGMLVASLWVLWPFQNYVNDAAVQPYLPQLWSAGTMLPLAMMLLGLTLSLTLQFYANRS